MAIVTFPTAPRHSTLPPPPLPDATADWALFLDVDGTLLDFVDDPAAVRPDAALLQLLQQLHRALDGALALVSGRELDELDRLFGQPRWAAAGLHGLQLRQPDGQRRDMPVPPASLARMREGVTRLAAGFAGVRLEDKHTAIALHCRQLAQPLAVLRAAAEQLAATWPDYELQAGHQVLEFKPAGADKGAALDALMQYPPFHGRRPVCLGDDLTDEHAFDVVNRRRGLSVRVGAREPSRASTSLADPAAVRAWLKHVLHTLTQGVPDAP